MNEQAAWIVLALLLIAERIPVQRAETWLGVWARLGASIWWAALFLAAVVAIANANL